MSIAKNLLIVTLLAAGVSVFPVYGEEKASSVTEQGKKEELTPEQIAKLNQKIQYNLDEIDVYKIYVKGRDGVTTVQFPSAITELSGRNIGFDSKKSDFLISAKPGSYYFSVSAVKENIHTTLTVTYNRKLYILYLISSPNEAYASVTFNKVKKGGFMNNVVTETPVVSNARLVSLLDIAKTYETLMAEHPDLLKKTSRHTYRNIYHCGDYNIHLDEVIRFEEEDTVVFRLRLENLTDKEILYDKTTFSASAGNGLYYMSVSDASGIMPPKSVVSACFAITSTPRGGRNNLLPKNDWRIAVTTQKVFDEQMIHVDSTVQKRKEEIIALKQELKQRELDLNKRAQEIEAMKEVFQKELAVEKQKTLEAIKASEVRASQTNIETMNLVKELTVMLKDSETKRQEALELHEKNSFWGFVRDLFSLDEKKENTVETEKPVESEKPVETENKTVKPTDSNEGKNIAASVEKKAEIQSLSSAEPESSVKETETVETEVETEKSFWEKFCDFFSFSSDSSKEEETVSPEVENTPEEPESSEAKKENSVGEAAGEAVVKGAETVDGEVEPEKSFWEKFCDFFSFSSDSSNEEDVNNGTASEAEESGRQ